MNKFRNYNFAKKKGFSLVEIIVASLLLALLATGIFSIAISSSRIIKRSSGRITAIEVAQTVLEDLRAYLGEGNWSNLTSPIYRRGWEWHDFDDLDNTFVEGISQKFGSSTFALSPQNGTWGYKIEDKDSPSSPIIGDYRKVQVQVNWTEPEI